MEINLSAQQKSHYNRLRVFLIILMSIVALAPLFIMTIISYNEYEEVFAAELINQVSRRISNTEQSIEFFISERLAALNFLLLDNTINDFSDNRKLTNLLSDLKNSFEGFVDLGIIDSKGKHRYYAGPYEVLGKNYSDQHWFQEVILKGIHVSEVFMGFRKFPHFVLAIKHEKENGDFYILRTTLNMDMLNKKLYSLELGPQSDACLINFDGFLQSPSRLYGKVLERVEFELPSYSRNTLVNIKYDEENNPYIFGYAYIDNSPFILIVTKRGEDFMASLFEVRENHMWILTISVVIILIVILRSTFYMVKRIEIADLKQAKVMHNIQYTNKMASIGRLAAGVAHEINNPLAIINEKAGLLKDIATFKQDFEYKDKVLDVVGSIIKSVDRCSTITHRLLGFAKRMDISTEVIDLELLLKEVSGFLEKEATLKNIKLNFNVDNNIPSIESDRGQLQQVFLNILTNAFYAVKEEEGTIDITAELREDKKVIVTISDNGVGISKENIDHIFEPFYTTKGKYGTGLGLSITYGIIQKLGGEIKVDSKLGEGTSFKIILPQKSNLS
jgi:signal transduction histidine kinase